MPSGNLTKTSAPMMATTEHSQNGHHSGDDDHIEKDFMDTKNGNSENHNSKTITSYDPTEYVQRTRVTKPILAKPAADPLQFIKVKPCNLYQSAQEQLKKAEEVKKVKEVKKEEPEDWQSNLDNWKSSRRKRVEHIIDRVVEVKKFEMEDFDKTRRKSKTFNEMLEERGTRGTKISLPVYADDDSNDLSDLGIGTSSVSGKSSLSEDFDNHSVMSDSQESTGNMNHHENGNDTNNSDFEQPMSNPSDSEYTYEGAIQDYKSRISRQTSNNFNEIKSKCQTITPEKQCYKVSVQRDVKIMKTQEQLFNSNNSQSNDNKEINNKNLPKIDISKKKELFEKTSTPNHKYDDDQTSNKINILSPVHRDHQQQSKISPKVTEYFQNAKSIKERLSSLGQKDDQVECKEEKIVPEKVASLKDRLSSLEKQISVTETKPITKIDVPIPSIKDRLSSLHSNISPSHENHHVREEVAIVPEKIIPKVNTLEERNNKINLNGGSCHVTPVANNVHNIGGNLIANGNTNMNNHCDLVRSTSGSGERCVILEFNGYSRQSSQDSCPKSPMLQSKEVKIEPKIESFADEEKMVEEKFQEISSSLKMENHPMEMQTLNGTYESCISSEPVNGVDDHETSVLEALEIAFDAIDREQDPIEINSTIDNLVRDHIYEDINDSDMEGAEDDQKPMKSQPIVTEPMVQINQQINKIEIETATIEIKEEPYYQVPKSCEPYYETPKPPKPVPLYENVDMFYSNGTNRLSVGGGLKEPPKEKPPPPPVDYAEEEEEEEEEIVQTENDKNQDPFRRINSTRRIKNEIRTQRSSFLGIAGTNDDNYLELSIAPPPDMISLLREEKRLEKQFYLKAGLYDNSDTGDSRDSGVSENHSRQSSELFTSSEELDDFGGRKGEHSVENHDNQEFNDHHQGDDELRMKTIEDQIREQEEVLRVERELLQVEQEELQRQRQNLILRENLARRELDHGNHHQMSSNRRSMTDINENGMTYVDIPNNGYDAYPVQTDFRKSMPDLQNFQSPDNKRNPPSPPAKPMRAQFYQSNQQARRSVGNFLQNECHNQYDPVHIRNNSAPINETTDEVVMRNNQPGNMSKHTLHALSAVPKPKYTDVWVQQNNNNRKSFDQQIYQNTMNLSNSNGNLTENMYRKSISTEYVRDPVVRKSSGGNTQQNFNYNKHWLIQEAEQRRIEQSQRMMNRHSMPAPISSHIAPTPWIKKTTPVTTTNGNGGNKPLPDAIIQTLTQRVQSRGVGERKSAPQPMMVNGGNHGRADPILNTSNNGYVNGGVNSNNLLVKSQDNVLSVSGKKKCSHCGDELGRGAAMIIESLRLFYHIDCFKCCVCCIQLGDGLNGTDVRVRNQKLHCHNCYSSDDGVKFSCV